MTPSLLSVTVQEYAGDAACPFVARLVLPDGTPVAASAETPESALAAVLFIWRSRTQAYAPIPLTEEVKP